VDYGKPQSKFRKSISLKELGFRELGNDLLGTLKEGAVNDENHAKVLVEAQTGRENAQIQIRNLEVKIKRKSGNHEKLGTYM